MFLFVLIVFLTVSFTNLGYDAITLSDKFNIYFANFFQMFKMALGESQTDEILELDGGPYFTGWALFIVFSFFTTIVYMNILIAVVSDEFEKVYDERETALYKIRLPYIIKYWQYRPNEIAVQNCVIVVPNNSEEK